MQGNGKETNQDVVPNDQKQTEAGRSSLSDPKAVIQGMQVPSITADTLNHARIGKNATVTIEQKFIGAQVTIGKDPAAKKAAFEKQVQQNIGEMADRLKQYYSTKGTITTLIQKLDLRIADIMLAITDYESKPYQAGVLEEQKVSSGGSDQKDESLGQAQQSAEILKYYESLHNPTGLIPAAQIFDTKPSLPEKERKEEGAEEKERGKNERPIKRLLVLGVAGTGKTTMSQYFAHQWATKQLWQEKFDYLFWLPLRNLTELSKLEKHSLAAAIYRECLQSTAGDAKEAAAVIHAIQILLKTQSSRILLVLDGYDEVGHLMGDASHPVTKVLQEAFATEHFIVTSRPYHLYHMIPFDRRLENTGFTDDNIHQYIQQYFAQSEKEAKGTTKVTESSQKLQDFLQANPTLWGMAHIPINLSLVCDEWQQLQETDIAKEQLTTTQLYQIIVEDLLRVYLRKCGEPEDEIFNATNEELQVLCRVELAFLERIAFEAMLQGRINLTSHLQQEVASDVSKEHAQTLRSADKKKKPVFEAALKVGLLRTVQASAGREIQKEHCFLHLTFQEFFAASYVVRGLQQPESSARHQEAIQFIQNNKYVNRYQVTFGFIAGLLSINRGRYPSRELSIFWKIIQTESPDHIGIGHLHLTIRCLEETRCDSRIPGYENLMSYIAQALKFGFYTFDMPVTEKMITDAVFSRLITTLKQAPKLLQQSGLLELAVKASEDKSVVIRKTSVKILHQFGEMAASKAVIATLMKAMREDDWEIRMISAETLGRMHRYIIKNGMAPAVIEMLSKVIAKHKHEHREINVAVVKTLGNLGEYAASDKIVSIFIGMLGSKHGNYLEEPVSDTLCRLGEKASHEIIIPALLRILLADTTPYLKRDALRLLRPLNKKAINNNVTVSVLIKVLQNEQNDMVRMVAMDTLSDLATDLSCNEKLATNKLLPALINVLETDTVNDVIQTAVKVLACLSKKTAQPQVVTALIRMTQSPRICDEVKAAAIMALNELGEKATVRKVISTVVNSLGSRDETERKKSLEILKMLGKLMSTEAFPMIAQLLKTFDSSGRKHAVTALTCCIDVRHQLTNDQLTSILISALEDKSHEVREAALEAVETITWFHSKKILRDYMTPTLIKILRQTGYDAQTIPEQLLTDETTRHQIIKELIARILNSRESSLKSLAIEDLGWLKESTQLLQIIPVLCSVLEKNDEDYWVCMTSIKLLGSLGEKAARPNVIAILSEIAFKHPNAKLAQEAIKTLGFLGEKLARNNHIILRLIKILQESEDFLDRAAAAETLDLFNRTVLRDDVTLALVRAMADENIYVHTYAKKGIECCIKLTNDTISLTLLARSLINELSNDEPDIRHRISDCLSLLIDKIDNKKLIPIFSQLLAQDESPWVRLTACDALGKLGVKTATCEIFMMLFEALKDKDQLVTKTAIQSLKMLPLPMVVKSYLHSLTLMPPSFIAQLALLQGVAITCTKTHAQLYAPTGIVEIPLPIGNHGQKLMYGLCTAFSQVAKPKTTPLVAPGQFGILPGKKTTARTTIARLNFMDRKDDYPAP